MREGLERNSSSGGERGIAGPKVTGSNPVCSFFVDLSLTNKYNDQPHATATGECSLDPYPWAQGFSDRVAVTSQLPVSGDHHRG